MLAIPLTITARNEEATLSSCLASIAVARAEAERALPIKIEPWVVLDDCTDQTEAVARAHGVHSVRSSGGKVEAQRAGHREGAFEIFCDADIRLAPSALRLLAAAMIEDPALEVAYAARTPSSPREKTPLARALYLYNLRRGYASRQGWFSGKLFAIRSWSIPTADEVRVRASRLPKSHFYGFDAGLTVDDIYLSRFVVLTHGADRIREIEGATVWFRPPETLRGMHRYYRRMRRELERMDRLFPETRGVHRQHGTRRADLLATAPWDERAYYGVFALGLVGCRVAYRFERLYYDRIRRAPLDPWPAIEETKRAL